MPSTLSKQRRAGKRAEEKARREQDEEDIKLSREVAAFNALYEPQREALETRLAERDARRALIRQGGACAIGGSTHGKGASNRGQCMSGLKQDGCEQGGENANQIPSDARGCGGQMEEDSANQSAGQTEQSTHRKTMAESPQQCKLGEKGTYEHNSHKQGASAAGASRKHQLQSESEMDSSNAARVRSKALTELLSLIQLEEPPTEPTARKLFEEQVQTKIKRILKSQRQRAARRQHKQENQNLQDHIN